jgi:undecaprenyl-diphosphatase
VAFGLMENRNTDLKKNLLILLWIILPIIIVLFFFDTQIWLAAITMIPQDYGFIPRWFSNWGLYPPYAVFALLLGYSLWTKNRKIRDLCLAYLKAQLVFSFAVVRFLKIVIGRPRPENGSDFIFFSLNSDFNSFPSGHSADAFVSGVFLFYLLKNSNYAGFSFLPLIYAFLIAVSRVFVSAHYPSDVAAGMAIGILGAWFFLFRRHRQTHPVRK